MFSKKFKLCLITLAFMLSISAVAAADTNSTDDVLAGDVDVEPPSGSSDLLSVSENAQSKTSGTDYVLTSEDGSHYSGSNYTYVLSKDNNPAKNVSVSLKINGVSYTKNTDGDGKVSIPLDVNAGTYEISAKAGNAVSKEKVDVLPVVIGKDLTKTYSNTKKYSATFLDSNGNPLKYTNVKFILNNKTYTKKTNAKGVASLEVNLKVGTYTVYAIHPKGYETSNKITIKSSISTSGVTKHYLSSKKYSATFYGKDGKPLSKKYVIFKAHGDTFYVKTNAKGVAKLSIVSAPSTFTMQSVNPVTGEKKSKTVKISPTMEAKNMDVFSDVTSKFKVTLYKNEKLVKGAKVIVYIDGAKKSLKTDAKGVASVSFKLSKGTYTFRCYDPYTLSEITRKVTVKAPTIKAADIVGVEDKVSIFTATLLDAKGNIAKNKEMQITLNGATKTVKTNDYGAASIEFKLKEGSYKVTCKDPSNGYTLTKTIKIIKSNVGKAFNQYGVSEDGYSILAIGRASAPGEMSKYGYTFYVTEFDRTCTYCGGHNLYWSIFYAGSEYADYGVFPATGNKENCGAEGMIVCADCDCDWSVFGHTHGDIIDDLTVITPTKACTKEDAYRLKSGNYVAS